MGTKYRDSADVPTEVIVTRLYRLAGAVTGGPDAMQGEFTMRVPAECDRDADLVLAEAARRLEQAEAEVQRVRDLAEKIRDIAIDSPASNNMQLIYRLACQQADALERQFVEGVDSHG